jgi:transposase
MRSIGNVVRAVLREAGPKLGRLTRTRFDERMRERAGDDEALMAIVAPLLAVSRRMQAQPDSLTRQVPAIVRQEATCHRLTTVPGVGPITALAFRATVDDPGRLAKSRAVGAHPGLTPARDRSGVTDIRAKISRCGDEPARTALHEAAHTLRVRSTKWSRLRARGMDVARRRGMARARVAVARKLGVILHRMWRDGADVRVGKAPTAAVA